jgi:molybdate transport system ATP-binding protein
MPALEFRARLTYASGFRIDATFTTDAPITALFGPSGCGKTSILSMIAGLRRPDEGRIALGGRVLFDHSTGEDLSPDARRVGYAFQDHLLFPHRNVRDNLLYGWKRRPRAAKAVDIDRAVRVLELGEVLDRYPHTLSGGQRQRVGLGRAVLCGPELLLLDEPLSSVEESLKLRVIDLIERVLTEWSMPTLYVSHDADEVRRIAGAVVRLDAGQVVEAKPGV